MAETHKEVVKVWIAPGCIVCDSCESDCPEVFDVQEETCVIRPEAMKADFTRALTPSILVAAEGCPVEVIKFETIEVEGPEPAAWKEKEAEPAGAPAGGGGGHAPAKKAAPVYEGPPDPKWAGLLRTAHTSGSRSAGGPAVEMRSAKAPASAVAAALPASAPPDAVAAAMVGSGFARPQPSVAERIREKAGITRREAIAVGAGVSAALVIAWGSLAAVGAVFLGGFQDFFVPKVTKEPPTTFRAGKLSDYPDPGVYEQFKGSQGVWIIKLNTGQIVALSTTCTHLGCIPNWLSADQKFKCPCHGSGFYMTGVNFEGPAPRPLERLKIALDGENIVVDKSKKFRQELQQWDLPGAYLQV
jgi:cytochrome b6-f complex iron-sulfur subunit